MPATQISASKKYSNAIRKQHILVTSSYFGVTMPMKYSLFNLWRFLGLSLLVLTSLKMDEIWLKRTHIYGTENTFLILIYERGCSAQCGHQITQQIDLKVFVFFWSVIHSGSDLQQAINLKLLESDRTVGFPKFPSVIHQPVWQSLPDFPGHLHNPKSSTSPRNAIENTVKFNTLIYYFSISKNLIHVQCIYILLW